MHTHISLILPLAGLTLCSTGCKQKVTTPTKPLNIVYIMTDDHTAQMMSCYDSRFASTPNLDRIANEGLRFTNAFVCNSISGPSRAVTLTGKHSHKNGKRTNEDIFDNSQQTVQQLLQQAGYQTAIVGKWHLGGKPQHFDYWRILPEQGDYYNPDFISATDTVRHEGYVTNVITDMSIDWLDNQRDKEKPFCLFVHHKAIHRNWMGDTTDLALFEDKTFPLPANFYDSYEGRVAAGLQEMSIDKDMGLVYDLKMLDPAFADLHQTLYNRGDSLGTYGRMNAAQKEAWNRHYQPIIDQFKKDCPTGRQLTEWKYQRYIRDYLKTVKSLDDNVGRLLDYLQENDLMDNTLIVYTSDQGFYMGEHGWFDKRFMYEESFHTPLLVRLPKDYSRQGVVNQLVQNIDYAPTFLDMAGVPVPADMQGVSLRPLFSGQGVENWRKELYYHYYEYPGEHAVRRHYGIRTEKYKLIRFYGDIEAWELYDLEADPTEMHNLYGIKEYEEITDTLKETLLNLQQKYEDPIVEQLNKTTERT